MEFYGFFDVAFGVLNRLSGGDAPRQVRNIGGIIAWAALNDYGVFHWSSCFSAACFNILRKVLGFKSSPQCPGTVTRPGRDAFLYCRWLPFVRTICHPCDSSSLITSLTFMTR